MRHVSLRWLLGVVAALGLVLAACSSPQTPESAAPENPVVELDGFQAQIEMSKVDLEPLSFWRPPMTQYCESNVAYAQVIVPMIGIDQGRLSPYVDVFWMPRDWNRKLALYAHGYISPGDPGFLDQILHPTAGSEALLETRDRLLCEGYALGASSFAAQGYAVQQGIAETHLMNAVFPLVFWRRPSETYVFGSSMGGLITVALAELFPNRYDGAMPTCGPVAGSLAEFSYVGNVRLLFDTAFPGVLGGTLTDWVAPADWLPDGVEDWRDVVLSQVLTLGPGGVVTGTSDAFQALSNTALSYPDAGTLPLLQTPSNYGALAGLLVDNQDTVSQLFAVNALLHALRYHVEGAGDAIERGGGSPFSNIGVSYGPLPGHSAFVTAAPPYPPSPALYQADPRAALYYTLFYQPTGNLHVPTLSLHTAVDPDVPYAHELLYAALVAAHPESAGMLHVYKLEGPVPDDLAAMAALSPVPITLPDTIGYGHCNFLPSDLVTALDALVAGDVDSLAARPRFTPGP